MGNSQIEPRPMSERQKLDMADMMTYDSINGPTMGTNLEQPRIHEYYESRPLRTPVDFDALVAKVRERVREVSSSDIYSQIEIRACKLSYRLTIYWLFSKFEENDTNFSQYRKIISDMGWSFDLYGREKWADGNDANYKRNIEFYTKQPTSLDKIPCGLTMDAWFYGWDWENMSLRDRLAKKQADYVGCGMKQAFPPELPTLEPGATNSTQASAPTIAAMEIEDIEGAPTKK